MGTIRVLSPVAESKISQSSPHPLPPALTGRAVGFLDNTKPNFDLLVRELERQLTAQLGVARVVVRRKAQATGPASPDLLAAFAGVDLVVTGAAD